MTLEQPLVANPVERLPARAPVQPRVPEPSNEPIEPLKTAIVRRSPVVLVVAPEFGIERRGLMLDRVVPMLLAPLRHRRHTASKAFAHGPDVNRKPPLPAARTHMRVSRPGEFHPQPLVEPDVSLSTHPAPVRRRRPPSAVASARKGTVASSRCR